MIVGQEHIDIFLRASRKNLADFLQRLSRNDNLFVLIVIL